MSTEDPATLEDSSTTAYLIVYSREKVKPLQITQNKLNHTNVLPFHVGLNRASKSLPDLCQFPPPQGTDRTMNGRMLNV